MVNLGPYTTSDSGGVSVSEYRCAFCSGVFDSFGSLYQHCKMTSLHEWCGRCERALRDEKAFDAHLTYSSYHNFCPQCDRDFPLMSKLHDHQVGDHHWCHECDSYFDNDNNLRMVRDGAFVSQLRNSLLFPAFSPAHNFTASTYSSTSRLQCYGCDRLFPSFSAMLIHLEAGNCTSGANTRILTQLISKHPLNHRYFRRRLGLSPYFCPRCKREFVLLSGLYQHAENVFSCRGHLQRDAPLGRCIDISAEESDVVTLFQ